jgi:6-phospho-beta-glucosidase
VRVPRLVHGLVDPARGLPIEEIHLYDTDVPRAEAMALLCRELAREARAEVRIEVAQSLDRLPAVDHILTAIRPGGDHGRARDEAVCRSVGLLGQETTGAAGFFMILRTVRPLLEAVSAALARSPDAWVLNFTNPAGVMTEALARAGAERVVGICDTPSHLVEELAPALGLAADRLVPSYTGLNHMGFFTGLADESGTDRLPEILARYEELSRAVRPLSYFPADWVRALGCLPVEYVHYYHDRAGTLQRQAAAAHGRGAQIESLNLGLWQALASFLPDNPPLALAVWREQMATRSATYMRAETGSPVLREVTAASYFTREGYEAVAIAVLQALAGEGERTLVLDAPARGAVAWAPPEEVFELSFRIGADGLVPAPGPALGGDALALLQSVKAYERLALQAALEPGEEAMVAALVAHPLVGGAERAHAVLRAAAAAGVEVVRDCVATGA